MKIRPILIILTGLVTSIILSSHSIRPRKIRKLINRSEILSSHFTGFALFDLSSRKMLLERESSKYFTPASNTKLFTFFAGLKMLKDSVPGLQYIERGDSLIFWGTADPTFLHPDFSNQPVISKLNKSGKKLFWATGTYTGDFYGTGWSYDDYNEYFQPEISELPIYGNVIRFRSLNDTLHSQPLFSSQANFKLLPDSSRTKGKFSIRRDLFANNFHRPLIPMPAKYFQEVPFKVDTQLISGLLKARLPLFKGTISYPKPANVKTWYSQNRDSVLKHMMLPSDNFIAEHLLLTCAAENNLEMNSQVVIDTVMKKFLSDLPDKPAWRDGSGLSRQNLFSPGDMIRICEKIYEEAGSEERLFNLLAQGGKSGTLKNYFKSEKEPFIFAKTGSLSNNHNLSGFLKTRKGKTLIFSFMNNNYVRPTAQVRTEMEKILTYIHQNY